MSRRAAGFALRLAVAVLGLVAVVHLALPEGEQDLATRLASSWTAGPATTAGWVAVAAAAFGASYAIGAVRFHVLLRSAGLASRVAPLLRSYLIASFFNLVLPGLILGDVYRLADARRDAGSGAAVLGIVVLERLLGFAALGTMAVLATPLLPGDTPAVVRLAVGAAGAATVALPLWLLGERGRRAGGAIAGALERVWPRGGEALRGALDAVARAGAEPAVIARAFALSVANMWLPVIAVVALAQPLDADVGLHWYAVIIPFTTLASLLPISIGGTGVREALFVALFGAVGMRAETALVLSLSTLGVALAWGLVGLALFALGRRDDTAVATT